jgi:uncharacterized protein (TIGR00725 family)
MRRPQIAVIGSARVSADVYALAEDLGRSLVDAGYRIVCGGRTGVMEAVARGARSSERATGSDVVGILLTTDHDDANAYVDITVPTGIGFARNTLVVAAGDAVVAVAGGAGTLSEVALAWQLRRPVIALVPSGGWAAELAGRALDDRLGTVVHEADSVPKAMALLTTLL